MCLMLTFGRDNLSFGLSGDVHIKLHMIKNRAKIGNSYDELSGYAKNHVKRAFLQ